MMKNTVLLSFLSLALSLLLVGMAAALTITMQPFVPPQGIHHLLNAQAATMHVPAFLRMAGLDVNTATAAQLETVKGIGPVLAGRIVAYREENGPFTNTAQLEAVHGVGPKLLEALERRCYIG